MSKFLLNLLVQISKALVYSKSNFYSKKNSLQISAQPRLCWPTLTRRLPCPRSAHSARAALAYLPKGVFPLTLRIPATTPSLSHVTAMWAPPVSFIPFPTLANLSHVTASGHPVPPSLQHRDANRSLYSPAMIPPFNPPLTSH
jgi:hypothetical protein